MQIRILAGCKRLMMALAIASLIIAPAGAAAPVSKGKPASGTPLTSGNAGQQVDEPSTAPEPIQYARSNYSWPFSSGPVYSTVDAASWSSAGMLHTAVGSFDLTRGLPNFPTELRAANKLDKAASQYFLMQVRPESFTDGTFDELKRAIVAQGGSIVGEMPVAAFVVRMTPGAHNAVNDSPSILALQPYQPALKLSPEIGRVPLLDAAKAASSVYSLKVQLFPGESVEAVAASLKAMGLRVKGNYSDVIFVDADRSKLAAIAALDPIFVIEEVLPIFLMSEETSTTVQAGKWNNGATPYTDAGVDGGGLDKVSQLDDQILAILDNGIQLDAGDLSQTSTDPGLDINGLPIAGHRKVAFYGTTAPFGGSGDLLGCDGNTTSGVTHGHTVAAVALGNATKVPVSYGTGFHGTDRAGNFWGLDGVAPKARLVAYDGQVTPLTGRCDDVTQIPTPVVGVTPLDPGDLSLLLPDAYAKGARIVNFSWGSVLNAFDINAGKIDAFLLANSDAMVFVAAGNAGRDKNADRIPDPNTVGQPSTAKNIICVGASRNADDLGNPNLPNSRWVNSGNGPATTFSGRIAPLLMAPGNDAGSLGLASEFHCRSNDNNQYGPVECDVISGQTSTSYASAAAAGAGLLVRDYFAQGFYPNGAKTAGSEVSTISGALLKAVLVTSAEWMHAADSNLPFGLNLTRKFRGNREQGFGRIVLTNALPLQSYPGAVTGLIVGDGGPAPAGLVNSTGLVLTAPYPASQSYSLNVCDTSQPLKIAIAWIDPSTATDGTTSRDLDLEVTAPSGRKYLGNFFADDTDNNNVIAGNEECLFTGQPWPPDSVAGVVDTGPWSLPSNTCIAGAHVDHNNNVEAVFLSPDSRLNGTANDPATSLDEAFDNQIEPGTWTVVVKNGPVLAQPAAYSIAIAGGVCLGSAARVQRVLPNNQLEGTVLTCNDSVVATVDEVSTGGDPIPIDANLFKTSIAARTVLQVVDANNVVRDTEVVAAADWTVVSSASGNVRFDSKKLLLTDGTAPESGNGALDVRDGQTIRVTYTDASPTVARIGTASVSCRPVLAAGGALFGNFGKDAFTLVDGGCEKDARGYFTFGFPDRYMDEGELVSYVVAFQSAEIGTDLVNASISLKAVMADGDSPASCKPGSTACADPNRANNVCASSTPTVVCPTALMTVLDSPKVYGVLPSGATLTPSFTVQMAGAITGIQKVDMIIGVTAKSAGKGVESLIAQREILNADEFSFFYSTDFPSGGTEPVGGYDINNNEMLETATSDPHNFTNDYFFETRAYSSMLATNPIATTHAPWNFDTDNGGFVNGLQNTSRPAFGTFAQWGEDKNYNGRLDGFCTGNLTIPCTQGIAASFSCKRCTGNLGRTCSVDLDCQSPLPNEGTCTAPFGVCDVTLDEDRNPAQGGPGVPGSLDTGWGTAGGCGWQTKAPLDTTGGVWHTGIIRAPGTGICLAGGSDPGDCQKYYATPDGDSVGDNNWWELLLTPVLHKVNLGVDGSGDPLYQVAITDWAWNMSVDIPDTNTQVTLEFDTDVNKSAGVDLFNDTGILVQFRGKQGAKSGGNGPITGGFNMFSRIANCQDTDGNGSLDHCGTAGGRLCNANKKKPDAECGGGVSVSPTRGLCSIAPAQKKCTGNRNLNCNVNADCNLRCSGNLTRYCNSITGTTCNGVTANLGCVVNATCGLAADGTCGDQTALLGLPSAGELCVSDFAFCDATTPCATGVCNLTAGNNREGQDNCVFNGVRVPSAGTELVVAQEPYGLATPNDDDAANGYCHRSDTLNAPAGGPYLGKDTSVSCTSAVTCEGKGGSYASIRSCSLSTTRVCTANTDCGRCSVNTARACSTSADCLTGEGTCTAGALGTCSNFVYTAACEKLDTGVDEFVQTNGPGRNYSIATSNGPDMRFTTLEDFYGDTGTEFQAALGFNNREPDINTTGIASGLGVAVDDMVISWKETRLDVDTHLCAGSGECATLETASTVSYEGNSVVSLTVTDRTPYDAVNNKNNCNGDFVCSLLTSKTCASNGDCLVGQGTCVEDYSDVTDTQDCNNNGKLDVTVKLTSDAEIAGEIAVLDQVAPGSPVYKTNFPYSTLYNSPGTLFVVQSGTSLPEVKAFYTDRNDGTGSFCKNAQEPTVQGILTSTTTVSATSGRVTVNSYSVVLANVCSGLTTRPCNTDAECSGVGTCTVLGPGDNDGFADTSEVNNLVVQFANKSGLDVDDLSATLGTSSPNVECITRSAIFIGSLADKALSNPATYLPFQFKVANVNRSNLTDILQAKFTITVRSNKFDALTRATEITLDLDFNASGGGTPALSLYEDFEAGFGKFTLEFLDKGLNTLAASNGYRCQYNDPLALNSNSASNKECFLGFTSDATTGVNDWHVHTTVSTMGVGRAFSGSRSLHLGVHDSSTAANDTTSLRHIMSVRTILPVNIGLAGASPELNFAQQVSFVDNSAGVNVSAGEAVDRGVVEAKIVPPVTVPPTLTNWVKLYPYVNAYDQQGTNDFSNCVFDPIDDGNNEDSFFDPTDPNRSLGPSSTCYPEFSFVRQGQTDYRKDFDATDIGLASDGPGLQPCSNPPSAICLAANTPSLISNPGTWVRPRFSLVPLAGQQANFRFLFSSIEIGATQTMFTFFGRPNISGDDGWYIDDIHFDGTLTTPISLTVDSPGVVTPLVCGACAAVTPALSASPAILAAPGQIVTLKANTSTVDRCLNGVLQYKFWNDVNGNGNSDPANGVGDAGDVLLRDWTDNSSFVDAPLQTTKYAVEVRCSTNTACDEASNSIMLPVTVTCPSLSTLSVASIRVNKSGADSVITGWGGALIVKIIRGDLLTMRTAGVTNVNTNGCLANNLFLSTYTDTTAVVAPGQGVYYLVQTPSACNVAFSGSFSENLPSEKPGTPATTRDADIAADPDSCP